MMHKYIKKFLSDYTNISEYYSYLINKTKQPEYVGITNEWIIDNYYLIIELLKKLEKRKGGDSIVIRKML